MRPLPRARATMVTTGKGRFGVGRRTSNHRASLASEVYSTWSSVGDETYPVFLLSSLRSLAGRPRSRARSRCPSHLANQNPQALPIHPSWRAAWVEAAVRGACELASCGRSRPGSAPTQKWLLRTLASLVRPGPRANQERPSTTALAGDSASYPALREPFPPG